MSAGKGDAPRPVDGQKFRKNYDEIFCTKAIKVIASVSAFVHTCPQIEAATKPSVETAAHAN